MAAPPTLKRTGGTEAVGRGMAAPPTLGGTGFNVGGGATRRPNRAQIWGNYKRAGRGRQLPNSLRLKSTQSVLRSHGGRDSHSRYGNPRIGIVLDEWCGTLTKDIEFAADLRKRVIRTLGAVPSDIGGNACFDILGSALQADDLDHVRKLPHIACLTNVTRQTIQSDDIPFFHSPGAQKLVEDPLGNVERLILEQSPGGQHALHKGDFGSSELAGAHLAIRHAPQIRAEVKMPATSPTVTTTFEGITQRRLPRPGGAKKKDRLLSGIVRICHSTAFPDVIA